MPGAGADPIPQLLARLDADQQRAGVMYEELRRRLILFFRLHHPRYAEDLADEVLDRVARKLAEGAEIDRIDFYMIGVARFVLRERLAAAQREQRAQEEIVYLRQSSSTNDPDPELYSAALTRCLQRLGTSDRVMILRYYGEDGSTRIRARQGLAEQLGINLNALHNRALRLRKQLEKCVSARVNKGRRW